MTYSDAYIRTLLSPRIYQRKPKLLPTEMGGGGQFKCRVSSRTSSIHQKTN